MDRDDRSGAGRNKRIIWIIAGLLIVVLLILAFQGMVRGGGEAVGVEQAAPGDDNATPAVGS